MALSEAVSRTFSEAVSPSGDGAASTSAETPASSTGSKATAFVLAVLLTFASVGALGYVKWWVPREQAQQQEAKVKYDHCLEEVKVYKGKKSYKGRLAQCTKFLDG